MNIESIRGDDIFRSLGSRKGILIDLREPVDYYRSHIPGAVNIPFDELTDRVEDIREMVMEKGSEMDVLLVLYCERGNKSLHAAWDLYRMGFTVKNVYGGLINYHGPMT